MTFVKYVIVLSQHGNQCDELKVDMMELPLSTDYCYTFHVLTPSEFLMS